MTEQSQVIDTETKVPQDSTNTQQQSNNKEANIDSSKPEGENPNEINWRKFRQEREKERKAKEESDRRALEKEREAAALKAVVESLVSKNSTPQYQQPQDDSEESEEQRIEKRVNAVIERREQASEAARRQKEAAELPQILAKSFNDFNSVCTPENLDYLEYHYPEVVAGYKNQPDSFDKWANIYKAAKRFIPNPDSRKEQARIEKNLSKPQSMSAPGATQTGDHAPIELTEKRRADNWARIQRTLKGVK